MAETNFNALTRDRSIGAGPNVMVANLDEAVPIAAHYRQTEGVDKTAQAPPDIDLEIANEIKYLSGLAGQFSNDPEMVAQINKAIGELSKLQGQGTGARSQVRSVVADITGVIAQHSVAPNVGSASSTSASTALLAGRPTPEAIYNSQYVNNGYVRENHVDDYLRELGYADDTVAYVENVNRVFKDTPLYNDAANLSSEADLADIPGYIERQNANFVSGNVPAFVETKSLGLGYLSAQELHVYQQSDLYGKLEQQAGTDPAARDLLNKLQTLEELYASDPEAYADKRVFFGVEAEAAIRGKADIDTVIKAYERDLDYEQSQIAVYSRFGITPEALGIMKQRAEDLDIDTNVPQGEWLQTLSILDQDSPIPEVQVFNNQRIAISDANAALYSVLQSQTPEEATAFAKMTADQKLAYISNQDDILVTPDIQRTFRQASFMFDSEEEIGDFKANYEKDRALVKEGNVAAATNLIAYQAGQVLHQLTSSPKVTPIAPDAVVSDYEKYIYSGYYTAASAEQVEGQTPNPVQAAYSAGDAHLAKLAENEENAVAEYDVAASIAEERRDHLLQLAQIAEQNSDTTSQDKYRAEALLFGERAVSYREGNPLAYLESNPLATQDGITSEETNELIQQSQVEIAAKYAEAAQLYDQNPGRYAKAKPGTPDYEVLLTAVLHAPFVGIA